MTGSGTVQAPFLLTPSGMELGFSFWGAISTLSYGSDMKFEPGILLTTRFARVPKRPMLLGSGDLPPPAAMTWTPLAQDAGGVVCLESSTKAEAEAANVRRSIRCMVG